MHSLYRLGRSRKHCIKAGTGCCSVVARGCQRVALWAGQLAARWVKAEDHPRAAAAKVAEGQLRLGEAGAAMAEAVALTAAGATRRVPSIIEVGSEAVLATTVADYRAVGKDVE